MRFETEASYDLVVVGGGPAGLCAAWGAARNGARVILFEKSREIGYPVHSSGASWMEDMDSFGVPRSLRNPVGRVTFRSKNEAVTYESDPPKFCVLDVRGLYQYLAARAADAGSVIQVATAVIGTVLEKGRVVGVSIQGSGGKETVGARVVVDASGFSSFLIRRLGLFQGHRRFGRGVEADLYAPRWNQGEALFMAQEGITPGGYGWALPWGGGRVRVGLLSIYPDAGGDPGDNLGKLMGKDFEGASLIEYHRGLLPWGGIVTQANFPGLLVIGDAAGQVSPLAGEGIRFAMAVGLAAGDELGKALSGGHVSDRFPRGLRSRLVRSYLKNFRISLAVNKRLMALTDEGWDRMIRIAAKLRDGQLYPLIRGDFTLSILLGLVKAEPGLFRSLARYATGLLTGKGL